MTVRVLYFAALRDLAGLSEELVEVDESAATIDGLLALLVRRHPAFDGRLRAVRVALNETFAETSAPLSPGDVVALIPPVAGG